MQTPEAALAGLARNQLGIVTRSQALGAGVSRHAIDLRLSDGRLRELHEGVFLHSAVPLTAAGRLRAAVEAAGPGAVASHRSAAVLHDLRGVSRWRPEVTVRDTTLPRRSGIHVHRTDRLDPPDRTHVGGVPCTTVARTLLDLGAVVPYEVVELAVQDGVIRKLVTPRERAGAEAGCAVPARPRPGAAARAASGWTLHEYGWADVTERPEAVRAELAALAA